MEPSETPLAQNKAVEIPASRHRRQSGGRQMPLWLRPYHTRRRRHQTSLQRKADVEAACRTERTFPMVRYFGEVAAVREFLVRGVFGSVDCIIGTMGQEERVRTATKESGEAVSEGNVAENMTVPRKAIGISINDYRSTIDARLRQCGTARPRSHFPIYQSQQPERCRRKAALKTKKPSIHHEPTANHINLSYL